MILFFINWIRPRHQPYNARPRVMKTKSSNLILNLNLILVLGFFGFLWVLLGYFGFRWVALGFVGF